MKWEIKKLLGTRMLLLLTVLLVCANAILFAGHGDDLELGLIRQMYEQREEKELAASRDQLEERVIRGDEPYDSSLFTGDIYRELSLVEETLARREAVEQFPETIGELRGQAQAKLRSGLFGAEDSFEARSLRLTDSVYATVQQARPQMCWFGGVEALLDYRVADVFAVLLLLAAVFLLFSQEREQGTLCLLRPTRRGHGRLYAQKCLAVLCTCLFLWAVLYGGCLAVAACAYGLGDLSAPVQSVYGLTTCPYLLSVGEFLLLFGLMKLLWLAALAGMLTALSNLLSTAYALTAAAALSVLSLGLGALPDNLPRCLNLLAAEDTAALFDGLLFLDFPGGPLVRLHAVLILCAALLMVGFGGGLALFFRRDAVSAARRSWKGPAMGRHTHPSLHEWRKLLLSHGALAVLALLVGVQIFTYRDYSVIHTTQDLMYQRYSAALSGEPSGEKKAYLEMEAARLAGLREEYDALMSASPENAGGGYGNNPAQQLQAQRPFEEARAQYEGLKPGQSYVCAIPYEALYDAGGRSADRTDLAKLMAVLSLTLPFFFGMERESGVWILIRSAGAGRTVSRRKRAAAWLFALVMMLAAYLPRLLAVGKEVGLPELVVRANSLALFASLPNVLPLWGVLVLTMVVRGALAVGGAAAIELLSARIKSSLICVLGSILILVGLVWLTGGLL